MSIYRNFVDELDNLATLIDPDNLTAEDEATLNEVFERIEDSFAEEEITEREHEKLTDTLGELGFDGV